MELKVDNAKYTKGPKKCQKCSFDAKQIGAKCKKHRNYGIARLSGKPT